MKSRSHGTTESWHYVMNDTELQVECKPYWNYVVKEQFEQHLASSQT